MSFFGSELGVAIAWICSVISLVYAVFQKQENKKLSIKLQNSLNTKIASDSSKNEIDQTGEKNIYTKQNNGGMNIKM